jgi:hypothetical protein
MNLSDHDRKILWSRAGNLCSYDFGGEKCNAELIRVENDKYVVIGEECHIVGEKPKAARYLVVYPERETYFNAILLCGVHHKIVDDSPDLYTFDVLHSMKDTHEEEVKKAIQNNSLQPLIIKDAEFLMVVENAQRAIGMEVNRPAVLSNIKSELHVGNVQEAIGFSTNQGLTATTIICSCGKPFSVVFTGTSVGSVVCPHCGIKHNINP